MCPTSINAIQGALGTVCEAVDNVITAGSHSNSTKGSKRAFVAIRPPGHHCGEVKHILRSPHSVPDRESRTPLQASALSITLPLEPHTVRQYLAPSNRRINTSPLLAHLNHNIRRIVIFDIDLHHGPFRLPPIYTSIKH